MKRTVNRFAVSVVSLAMLAGVSVASAAEKKESPMSVTGATTVDAAKAKALFDKGVPFVDVRNDKDWNAGRIPGAVHLDLHGAFNDGSFGKVAKKEQEVALYCNGASCPRSAEASAKAVGWGYKKVYYFRDGFPAWKTAGYPVE